VRTTRRRDLREPGRHERGRAPSSWQPGTTHVHHAPRIGVADERER